MPKGLVVIALCMVNHTSSRGCFSQAMRQQPHLFLQPTKATTTVSRSHTSQMLTTFYTSSPMHTLRIGQPLNVTEYVNSRALGGRNNVQV